MGKLPFVGLGTTVLLHARHGEMVALDAVMDVEEDIGVFLAEVVDVSEGERSI